jgi:hypothetical protein
MYVVVYFISIYVQLLIVNGALVVTPEYNSGAES